MRKCRPPEKKRRVRLDSCLALTFSVSLTDKEKIFNAENCVESHRLLNFFLKEEVLYPQNKGLWDIISGLLPSVSLS